MNTSTPSSSLPSAGTQPEGMGLDKRRIWQLDFRPEISQALIQIIIELTQNLLVHAVEQVVVAVFIKTGFHAQVDLQLRALCCLAGPGIIGCLYLYIFFPAAVAVGCVRKMVGDDHSVKARIQVKLHQLLRKRIAAGTCRVRVGMKFQAVRIGFRQGVFYVFHFKMPFTQALSKP